MTKITFNGTWQWCCMLYDRADYDFL